MCTQELPCLFAVFVSDAQPQYVAVCYQISTHCRNALHQVSFLCAQIKEGFNAGKRPKECHFVIFRYNSVLVQPAVCVGRQMKDNSAKPEQINIGEHHAMLLKKK